jgi:cytochrome c peroxidase
MLKRKLFAFIGITATAATVASCFKTDEILPSGMRVPELPATTFDYSTLPSTAPFNAFGEGHTVDSKMATLGRVLFYDTQLSRNNRISCSSCHVQAKGFSDPNRVSLGFEDIVGNRNAPAIINPGAQTALFWDMRETTLHSMVLKPIGNHIEMGMADQNYMVTKVRSLPYYEKLILHAFGDTTVSSERIATGLENFLRAMVSVQSKYDVGLQNGFANFTEKERKGREHYFVNLPCSGCHGGPNLGGAPTSEDMNIGLNMDYRDNGTTGVDPESGAPKDGWFKVPSLRNIAVSAPYMHDGRFQTLEQVLEFYNSGVQAHPQLNPMLRMREDGGFFFLGPPIDVNAIYPGWTRLPIRMHMTPEQKEELLAFLNTLTDYSLLTDERFSNPFVIK